MNKPFYMNKINPFLLTDWYKVGHPFQYPKGTTLVYSNMTPRSSRMDEVDKVVFFGLQYFIKEYLINYFNENFFKRNRQEVIEEYARTVRNALGSDLPTYKHIKDLHELGYLPICIKAIDEVSLVNIKVPVLTLYNTKPEFYWLPNFLETLMSSVLWQPTTSATIAYEYRKLLDYWATRTGMPLDFVQWQGHDFSFRGMSSVESAVLSGAGHLLSFTGTDTIPAIDFLEKYYKANSDLELIGGSVPATEHSVMCAGSKEGEFETFKRLITEVYPTGIVSIVSDSWDLWTVLTDYLPRLKDEIMARDGKVVIRPDSGDPVDILCGKEILCRDYRDIVENAQLDLTTPKYKGVVELLWDVFGGTITSTGHKLLDSHIGVIYGDSITLDRCERICERLSMKGFASQPVFGIGSYTYQYNTRDTFGFAMKATYCEINGEPREIFKDPITDSGMKKSAKGLLAVYNDGNNYFLQDQVTWQMENSGELETVFLNGKLVKDHSLQEVRNRLKNQVDMIEQDK